MIVELGRQARLHTPFMKDPLPHAIYSVNVFWIEHGSMFPWNLKMFPHLFFMGWHAVTSCELMLVSLDPEEAKKSGTKAKKKKKKGPYAQQISPETLGIYNYSLFAGKRWHSNLCAWHSHPLPAENPLPSITGCPHTAWTAFAPTVFSSFLPPSLPVLLKDKVGPSKGQLTITYRIIGIIKILHVSFMKCLLSVVGHTKKL